MKADMKRAVQVCQSKIWWIIAVFSKCDKYYRQHFQGKFQIFFFTELFNILSHEHVNLVNVCWQSFTSALLLKPVWSPQTVKRSYRVETRRCEWILHRIYSHGRLHQRSAWKMGYKSGKEQTGGIRSELWSSVLCSFKASVWNSATVLKSIKNHFKIHLNCN